MDIFEDGKYEGIAYLREISTGREMLSVSDEESNISTRGLEKMLFWWLKTLRNNGFSVEECEKGLLVIVENAFEMAETEGPITRE